MATASKARELVSSVFQPADSWKILSDASPAGSLGLDEKKSRLWALANFSSSFFSLAESDSSRVRFEPIPARTVCLAISS